MTDEKQLELKYPVTSFYCDPSTNRGLRLLMTHYTEVGSLDGEKVTQSSTIRGLVAKEVRELKLVETVE